MEKDFDKAFAKLCENIENGKDFGHYNDNIYFPIKVSETKQGYFLLNCCKVCDSLGSHCWFESEVDLLRTPDICKKDRELITCRCRTKEDAQLAIASHYYDIIKESVEVEVMIENDIDPADVYKDPDAHLNSILEEMIRR